MVRSPRLCLVALALGALPAMAAAQTSVSSTQKYAEKYPSASKVATSGASLSARMLYGMDGRTEGELTAGEFDSGVAPPHLLSKVSLRGVDGEGVELFQINYGPRRGRLLAAGLRRLRAGAAVQHLRAGAHDRNQLVVVSATVRRRPTCSSTTSACRAVQPSTHRFRSRDCHRAERPARRAGRLRAVHRRGGGGPRRRHLGRQRRRRELRLRPHLHGSGQPCGTRVGGGRSARRLGRGEQQRDGVHRRRRPDSGLSLCQRQCLCLRRL